MRAGTLYGVVWYDVMGLCTPSCLRSSKAQGSHVVARTIPSARKHDRATLWLPSTRALLQMCEETEESDLRQGLPGFMLTGDAEPTDDFVAQLRKRHAVEVLRARSANAIFERTLSGSTAGATEGVGAGAAGERFDRSAGDTEIEDARMSDAADDSDSLFSGSECEEIQAQASAPSVPVTPRTEGQVQMSPSLGLASRAPSAAAGTGGQGKRQVEAVSPVAPLVMPSTPVQSSSAQASATRGAAWDGRVETQAAALRKTLSSVEAIATRTTSSPQGTDKGSGSVLAVTSKGLADKEPRGGTGVQSSHESSICPAATSGSSLRMRPEATEPSAAAGSTPTEDVTKTQVRGGCGPFTVNIHGGESKVGGWAHTTFASCTQESWRAGRR